MLKLIVILLFRRQHKCYRQGDEAIGSRQVNAIYLHVSFFNFNCIVCSQTVTSTAHQYQINYEIEPLSPIDVRIGEDVLEVEDSSMGGGVTIGNTFGEFTEIHYENEEPQEAILQNDASNETFSSVGTMLINDQTNSSDYHKEIDEMLANLQNGQCENVVSDNMFKEIRDSMSILYN